MYKLFMLIALPVLGVCWVAYAVWLHKVRKEEKNRPKPVSKRLEKTRSEVLDWAQKMATMESPREKALRRRRELKAQRQQEEQKKQQPDS